MKEYPFTDFKMFEKAPYEKPDPKALLEVDFMGPKEREKVYGPAFTAEFIKYALMALAKQTGEKPPENIKTLDQLKEYLISKAETLQPPPYYILIWAQYVTDKKFEGSLAAGTNLMYKGITKKIADSDGNTNLHKSVDVYPILLKLRQTAIKLKIAPLEFGYKDNGDGTIDVMHGSCFFFEGCNMSLEWGMLQRADCSISCGIVQIVCHYLKMATHNEWDYTVLKLDKQNCISKCFPL